MNSKDFLKLLDDHELNVFDAETILAHTGLSFDEWKYIIRSLLKNGLILLLEKGKFVRHNFSDEKVIGSFVVDHGAISYWSALHHYGYTTQIPNTVFVQSTQRKRSKVILGVPYHFIHVTGQQHTGILSQGFGNNTYYITDIEKTIIDCLHKPLYGGEYPELIKAIYQADLQPEKLIKYTKAIQSGAVIKRLAYYIDVFEKESCLSFLDFALAHKTKGYTLLHPLGEKSGQYINKWDLCLNVAENDILQIVKSDN